MGAAHGAARSAGEARARVAGWGGRSVRCSFRRTRGDGRPAVVDGEPGRWRVRTRRQKARNGCSNRLSGTARRAGARAMDGGEADAEGRCRQ